MTSVLATGAVANADQVNVIENPADYINLQGIYDDEIDDNGQAVSGKLQPSQSVDQSYNPYWLRLQVLEPSGSTLNQVAVCLYDSASVTGSQMRTVCGDGFSNPGSILANGAGLKDAEDGEDRPQMAHSFAFLPILNEPGSNPIRPGVAQGAGNDYHLIAAAGTTGLASKVDNTGTTFPGGKAADDTVWDLQFVFALNYKARLSDNWKIRVLATYDDTNEIELLDTQDYGVAYWGQIDTRTSVTYPDVIGGNQTQISNVPTGQYNANGKSDITLQASLFEIAGVSNSALSMDNTATPGAENVSLACVQHGQGVSAQDFFGAIDASTNPGGTSSQTLFSNVAASNESDDNNAQSKPFAERHSCTLHVGVNVPTGTYSNVMTVGIGGVQ